MADGQAECNITDGNGSTVGLMEAPAPVGLMEAPAPVGLIDGTGALEGTYAYDP